MPQEPNDYTELKAFIKQVEGKRNEIYYDSAGHATIGYGHMLTEEDKQSGRYTQGISDEEADALFEQDFAAHLEKARNAWGGNWDELSPQQQSGLIDLVYNGALKMKGVSSGFETGDIELVRQNLKYKDRIVRDPEGNFVTEDGRGLEGLAPSKYSQTNTRNQRHFQVDAWLLEGPQPVAQEPVAQEPVAQEPVAQEPVADRSNEPGFEIPLEGDFVLPNQEQRKPADPEAMKAAFEANLGDAKKQVPEEQSRELTGPFTLPPSQLEKPVGAKTDEKSPELRAWRESYENSKDENAPGIEVSDPSQATSNLFEQHMAAIRKDAEQAGQAGLDWYDNQIQNEEWLNKQAAIVRWKQYQAYLQNLVTLSEDAQLPLGLDMAAIQEILAQENPTQQDIDWMGSDAGMEEMYQLHDIYVKTFEYEPDALEAARAAGSVYGVSHRSELYRKHIQWQRQEQQIEESVWGLRHFMQGLRGASKFLVPVFQEVFHDITFDAFETEAEASRRRRVNEELNPNAELIGGIASMFVAAGVFSKAAKVGKAATGAEAFFAGLSAKNLTRIELLENATWFYFGEQVGFGEYEAVTDVIFEEFPQLRDVPVVNLLESDDEEELRNIFVGIGNEVLLDKAGILLIGSIATLRAVARGGRDPKMVKVLADIVRENPGSYGLKADDIAKMDDAALAARISDNSPVEAWKAKNKARSSGMVNLRKSVGETRPQINEKVKAYNKLIEDFNAEKVTPDEYISWLEKNIEKYPRINRSGAMPEGPLTREKILEHLEAGRADAIKRFKEAGQRGAIDIRLGKRKPAEVLEVAEDAPKGLNPDLSVDQKIARLNQAIENASIKVGSEAEEYALYLAHLDLAFDARVGMLNPRSIDNHADRVARMSEGLDPNKADYRSKADRFKQAKYKSPEDIKNYYLKKSENGSKSLILDDVVGGRIQTNPVSIGGAIATQEAKANLLRNFKIPLYNFGSTLSERGRTALGRKLEGRKYGKLERTDRRFFRPNKKETLEANQKRKERIKKIVEQEVEVKEVQSYITGFGIESLKKRVKSGEATPFERQQLEKMEAPAEKAKKRAERFERDADAILEIYDQRLKGGKTSKPEKPVITEPKTPKEAIEQGNRVGRYLVKYMEWVNQAKSKVDPQIAKSDMHLAETAGKQPGVTTKSAVEGTPVAKTGQTLSTRVVDDIPHKETRNVLQFVQSILNLPRRLGVAADDIARLGVYEEEIAIVGKQVAGELFQHPLIKQLMDDKKVSQKVFDEVFTEALDAYESALKAGYNNADSVKLSMEVFHVTFAEKGVDLNYSEFFDALDDAKYGKQLEHINTTAWNNNAELSLYNDMNEVGESLHRLTRSIPVAGPIMGLFFKTIWNYAGGTLRFASFGLYDYAKDVTQFATGNITGKQLGRKAVRTLGSQTLPALGVLVAGGYSIGRWGMLSPVEAQEAMDRGDSGFLTQMPGRNNDRVVLMVRQDQAAEVIEQWATAAVIRDPEYWDKVAQDEGHDDAVAAATAHYEDFAEVDGRYIQVSFDSFGPTIGALQLAINRFFNVRHGEQKKLIYGAEEESFGEALRRSTLALVDQIPLIDLNKGFAYTPKDGDTELTDQEKSKLRLMREVWAAIEPMTDLFFDVENIDVLGFMNPVEKLGGKSRYQEDRSGAMDHFRDAFGFRYDRDGGVGQFFLGGYESKSDSVEILNFWGINPTAPRPQSIQWQVPYGRKMIPMDGVALDRMEQTSLTEPQKNRLNKLLGGQEADNLYEAVIIRGGAFLHERWLRYTEDEDYQEARANMLAIAEMDNPTPEDVALYEELQREVRRQFREMQREAYGEAVEDLAMFYRHRDTGADLDTLVDKMLEQEQGVRKQARREAQQQLKPLDRIK